MKQRSLFRKYFFASTGLILLTIGFLGIVFLSFASQYFQNDRFSTLHQNAVYALEATEKFCVNVDGTYKVSSALDDVYIPIAKAIDADIFLTNVNGNTLICTGHETCSHRTRPIPSDILTTVGEELSYQGITDLGGIYQSKHYTVALPLIVGDQQIAGMVFVASDAGDLTDFLKEMLEMFLVSAICVIIIAFAVIYVISSNMVRPLRSMVSATESFARGDFTVRVPVTEMDEIGKLSMAFNNMATALAQQDS
ncbi:MAG: HAMP domain-containing protein, partial [Oscillospiraceae bacterium]|nr:HAMP domain-containing protein [Oscillospiraceae bacterium]